MNDFRDAEAIAVIFGRKEDLGGPSAILRSVHKGGKWQMQVTQRKSRPKAASNSNPLIAVQAANIAGFDVRR